MMTRIKFPLLGAAIAIGFAGVTPHMAEAHGPTACKHAVSNDCLANAKAVRACKRQAEIVCYQHVHDSGMESFNGAPKPNEPLRKKGPRPIFVPVQ
jgi:hypothetical protein